MKTIIRNFINVLIRFKVATFLNVAGLAVALSITSIVVIRTRPGFIGWDFLSRMEQA